MSWGTCTSVICPTIRSDTRCCGVASRLQLDYSHLVPTIDVSSQSLPSTYLTCSTPASQLSETLAFCCIYFLAKGDSQDEDVFLIGRLNNLCHYVPILRYFIVDDSFSTLLNVPLQDISQFNSVEDPRDASVK